MPVTFLGNGIPEQIMLIVMRQARTWDLGPFPGMLAPGQTSQATECQTTIRD